MTLHTSNRKPPHVLKDPFTHAQYKRIGPKGIQLAGNSFVLMSGSVFRVHEGDLIVFREEAEILDAAGQVQHTYNHFILGRALGLVVKDGAGQPPAQKSFMVLRMAHDAASVYGRFVPFTDVVAATPYGQAHCLRWLATSKLDFEDLEGILRMEHYGGLTNNAMAAEELLDSTDAELYPPWRCPFYHSRIVEDWLVQPTPRHFEVWLTRRGFISDTGDLKAAEPAAIERSVDIFLNEEMHLDFEEQMVREHAARIAEFYRSGKK